MKKVRMHLPAILVSLAELAIGIVLLFRPVGFTSGIIVAAGIALAVKGLISVGKYVLTAAVVAEKEQTLAKGLIALSAGILCIVKYEWFIQAFPVLTVLYGVALLIMGFYKVQHMADLKRQKKTGVGLAAVNALLAITFAVLILLNPFASTAVLWTFTAIGLLVEAVVDVVSITLDVRKSKEA